MAEYTTEVRSVCEFYAGLSSSQGQSQILNIIERSREKIFDFPYPIFNEDYKSVLETKILQHYYTREIGEETVGLWKLRLSAKLNEIMPYYNKLYLAEEEKINPFTTVYKTTEGNKKGDSNSTDERSIRGNSEGEHNKVGTNRSDEGYSSTGTKHDTTLNSGSDTTRNNGTETEDYTEGLSHVDLFTETPQSGVIDAFDAGYLTNARDVEDNKTLVGTVTSDGTSVLEHGHIVNGTDEHSDTYNKNLTGTNSENSTERSSHSSNDRNTNVSTTTDEYVEKITGFEGISYSKLLREYRDNIINIDLLIINELKDLFFQLW